MFTGFRSIVACEEVRTSKSGRTSLINVLADPLRAAQRPGLATVAFLLSIETDLQPSIGNLRLRCAGFDEAFVIEAPAGMPNAGVALRFDLPMIETGDLTFTMEQGEGLAAPQTRWSLGFLPDARVLVDHDEAVARIVAQGKFSAQALRDLDPGGQRPN